MCLVIGNMTDIPRLARGDDNGQSIAEHALTLAVVLVIVACSVWFIVHPIIGR